MNKFRNIVRNIVFFLLLIGGSKAPLFAQEKAPKPIKSNAVKRYMHNLTTRYNYYYNAKLKLNAAIKKSASANEDDYTKILPIYTYDTDMSGGAADMDDIIKRCSNGISFHPLSKWKPDCYLILGKAYYFKKESQNALDAFQFIQTQYKEKLVKGKPIKTKYRWYEHKPITNEALLWLIKSYIQMGKLDEADAVITAVKTRKTFPVKYQNDLKLLHTALLIKKENYVAATIPLEDVLKNTEKPKSKTRNTFILAQLYESAGNKATAIKKYKEVLYYKPNYIMAFNARMKIVKLYLASKEIPPDNVRGMLYSMLLDKKNDDFYDQIYYMLAEISLRQGKKDEAINYLKQSVRVSTVNTEQKGLSFKRLAEIYFDKQLYITCKNRYDSTLTYLPKTYEGYDEIKEKRAVLQELVNNIKIIQREDSLQKLALMNPEDLNRKLDKLIKKAEQKALEDSLANVAKNDPELQNKAQAAKPTDGGTFYFYNPGLKGTGYTDFVKKWGKRELKDNWRRSKSRTSNASNDNDNPLAENQKDKDSQKEDSKLSPKEKLAKDIPKSSEDLKASDDKVIEAYYAMANIYKQKLNNDPKAIETFEKLVKRYPNCKYNKESYYNLYLLYDKANNFTKAEYYKNILLTDFPTSTYAKLLNDPDFINKQKKKENEVQDFYAETYTYYSNKEYAKVISRVKQADDLYKNNPLKPKFDLLEALAIGKTEDLPTFTASLTAITIKYPNDDVKKRAQEILDMIAKRSKEAATVNVAPAATNEKPAESAVALSFAYDANAEHYVMIVFNKVSQKNNQVIGNITNYNETNHSLDNLNAETTMIDENNQVGLVKKFANANAAKTYSQELNSNGDLFKPIKKDDFSIYLISKENYNLLIKTADPAGYQSFYNDTYLK